MRYLMAGVGSFVLIRAWLSVYWWRQAQRYTWLADELARWQETRARELATMTEAEVDELFAQVCQEGW